jgi:DNA polymerase-1
MACSILQIPYEEGLRRLKLPDGDPLKKEIKTVRQMCKVAHFGFPGGLGIPKLCLFAKKNGVTLTPDNTPGTGAKWLKDRWFEQYPEMRDYFAHVAALCDQDEDGLATIEQVHSRRLRGGCSYTSACNGYFQGLGADATKHAGWLIAKAAYASPESVLFGSRLVNYVHDEFFLETDDTPAAHDVAMEMGRLFLEGVNAFLPDVPAKTQPLLTRVWSKDAEPVYGADGRLVPWEPKEKAA